MTTPCIKLVIRSESHLTNGQLTPTPPDTVVLISSDDQTLHVPTYVLRAGSDVFSALLASSLTSSPIPIDAPSRILSAFLLMLHNTPITTIHPPEDLAAVIRLADADDSHLVHERAHSRLARLAVSMPWRVFVAAGVIGDVDLGRRCLGNMPNETSRGMVRVVQAEGEGEGEEVVELGWARGASIRGINMAMASGLNVDWLMGLIRAIEGAPARVFVPVPLPLLSSAGGSRAVLAMGRAADDIGGKTDLGALGHGTTTQIGPRRGSRKRQAPQTLYRYDSRSVRSRRKVWIKTDEADQGEETFKDWSNLAMRFKPLAWG